MITVRLLVDGAAVREQVFAQPAVLIGRGPEADFVIGDPSVSRGHVRVRLDGAAGAFVEDTGSRNGLWVDGARVTTAVVPATGALRCRLGAAEVELRRWDADDTLELPVPSQDARAPLKAAKALALWATGVAGMATLSLVNPSFWSPWNQEERLPTLSWAALGAAVALPVLAFLLVGLLRVVGRKPRLTETLGAFAAVTWAWAFVSLLSEAAFYGLSVGAHGWFDGLLGSATLVVTIAYLASLGRRNRRKRFFLAWAAAGGVLAVGFYAAGRLAARQSGEPQVSQQLRAPLRPLAPPASGLDAYLEQVRSRFAAAERSAQEERRRMDAPRP